MAWSLEHAAPSLELGAWSSGMQNIVAVILELRNCAIVLGALAYCCESKT